MHNERNMDFYNSASILAQPETHAEPLLPKLGGGDEVAVGCHKPPSGNKKTQDTAVFGEQISWLRGSDSWNDDDLYR